MAKLYRPGGPPLGEHVHTVFGDASALVRTEAGQVHELRWSETTLRLEGFEDAFVAMCVGDVELWVPRERLPELEQLQLPDDFASRLAALTRTDRDRRTTRTLARYGGIGAFCVTCVWVCSGGPAEWLVAAAPYVVDETVGATAEASQPAIPCDDPQAQAAVDAILVRLVRGLDDADRFDWTARIIVDPVPNAYALPGGHLTVHSGLLALLQSEDEMASVLGHEIVHAYDRHGLVRVVYELGVTVLIPSLLGDASAAVMVGSAAAATASTLSYSRSQETAADHEGQRLSALAGYDPLAAGDALERIADYEGDLGAALSVFSTHPDTQARADELRARAGSLERGTLTPGFLTWEAVHRKCGEVD